MVKGTRLQELKEQLLGLVERLAVHARGVKRVVAATRRAGSSRWVVESGRQALQGRPHSPVGVRPAQHPPALHDLRPSVHDELELARGRARLRQGAPGQGEVKVGAKQSQ